MGVGGSQFRVGVAQGVQLCTTLWAKGRAEPAMDLFGRVGPCSRHRSHEPVQTRTDHVLGAQVLEGQSEQHGGGVVLERPCNQPIAQGLPLSSPAGTPTSSDDHKRDMLPTGAAAHLVRIAAETASRRTELVRQTLHDLARRGH